MMSRTRSTSPISRTVSRRSLLAGAGAAGAGLGLAACGGGSGGDGGTPESDPDHKDLVMTVWGGEADKIAYQARVDLAKEKFPDYTITLQLIPSENYEQKVQTMISSKTGPDIMQVAENVNVYSSKQQLVPLDDYISAAGLDMAATFGPVGENYRWDGKTYGIPDRSGAMVLYYNKDLFDAAGIEYPTADWDWDTFLDAAKALTDPAKGQFGYGGVGWWPQWFSLVAQNGGAVLDPETGAPSVNSPEAVEALQWAQDLYFTHKVAPTAVDYSNMGPEMGADGAFQQGLVAMNSTGFWAVGGNAGIEGLNWDIAPFFHGKEKAVSAFGSALVIPTAAKNPQASFEIIQFLTSAEGQTPIADLGQDVPANLELQGSDAFLDPEWLEADANLEAFPESADMIFTPKFIPEWNEMQKSVDDAMASFWLGESDAKTTADDLQSRLERVIKPSE
ncbi:sugar ABC transporter substrate-binding protein [Brachybacterium phenoliresistens]|uniref:Sugar ABC transporter substrate-binding protein n=2 Tax=Brachybacterium phenoliresistens TaxID=396014 RepID=Z9JNX0_9MICO|nr:sugar ABC transporter substrate-binding protein [Brachybacterium phenoliresistens]